MTKSPSSRSPPRERAVRASRSTTSRGTSSWAMGKALSGSTISVPRLASASAVYSSKVASRNAGSNFRSCATLPCTSDTGSGSPAGAVHSARPSRTPPATIARIASERRGDAAARPVQRVDAPRAPARRSAATASETSHTPPSGA